MNNNMSEGEKRRIYTLLGQGIRQAEVARIVKRSRMTITTMASDARKLVAESQARPLTRLRKAK